MNKDTPRNENQGGYYGGYYYGEGYSGYGYGGGPEGGSAHRGLKDYLAILRERIWWLFIAVFVVVVAVAMYTFNATPLYRAGTTVQVLRQKDQTVQFSDIVNTQIANNEDFNTEVGIIESIEIVKNVAARLKGEELRRFMAPYEDSISLTGKQKTPAEILVQNRKVSPRRLTLIVVIEYQHPDKAMAARIANYFAEEYISYKLQRRIESSMRAVDELKQRAEGQRKRVEELEYQLADFKERYKTISFDAATDIDQQQMVGLNEMLVQDKRILDESETVWKQVQRAKEEGEPLYSLPAIVTYGQIQDLLANRSQAKISLASLSQKYREKHPMMIQAREALAQIETELDAAIRAAVRTVENNYQRAQANYKLSQARIADKQREIMEMQRIRVEYRGMLDQLNVTREMYEYLLSRMQQAMTLATDDAETARVVDPAYEPLHPSSPRPVLNLALAVIGGFGLGLGLIFVFALLDDKVKTSFDIESSVGLPIVGLIPRITKSDASGKARIVATQEDRHTVEAFRAIHSSLKLNDESRTAKVILTTSTIPSEGKSFVTTNMAFTFANHGERTLIIDCDLRMPNIAKSLEIENNRGILQYMSGEASLDDVIQRNVEKNVDVLTTGGSTRDSTQVLCSDRFEEMLHELRLRYDKIFIDSPPLAPVSDALNLLPMTDGVIYVIRFNMVKRKTATLNVRRLRESNVPVFGAVLNNINASVAGYYYSHYYDVSYRKYYGESRKTAKAKEREPAETV